MRFMILVKATANSEAGVMPTEQIPAGMGRFNAVLVADSWIWQCASLQGAIAWVKRWPNPTPGDSDIEIRQIYKAEDFGAALTPELREQEERLHA